MEERLLECLRLALLHNVSDIHFNLINDNVTIEMRLSKRIRKLKPKKDDLKFFRYLQYKSNIDISNKLLPQTGRFETIVDKKLISLRFSIINSYRLTNGVLRILNAHNKLEINNLAVDENTIRFLNEIKNHGNGLFVFSGPTGSGKTTTLYTILNSIVNKKIFTLEDPIEVYSDKYVQLQINEKQNLNYAQGIKQLMRHDPDIIMIGEIRDEVAATMAIRSALTGHLVLTSIHAGNTEMAINRLLELGVNKYQLFDVLQGISNQRLYPKVNYEEKTGIYEIMNREEVLYYLQHKTHSKEFTFLKSKIQDAINKNIIEKEFCFQDLYR